MQMKAAAEGHSVAERTADARLRCTAREDTVGGERILGGLRGWRSGGVEGAESKKETTVERSVPEESVS